MRVIINYTNKRTEILDLTEGQVKDIEKDLLDTNTFIVLENKYINKSTIATLTIGEW